jgi:LysR family transcriptional activator of nhaA
VDWLNFHHLRYFWVVAREGSVSRAAKVLRIGQPTVSEQLRELQERLGEPLLRRDGRNLVLTEVGESVARIADEIFALGDRVLDTVRGRATGPARRLAVGISDSVPKHVAHRILEPALEAHTQLTCREASPAQLIAELAGRALDVVISDAPSHEAGVTDHLLGECGVGVWGTRRLAAEMRVGFPRSLDGARFLLPSVATGFRRELDAWFVARGIRPTVVGEFQDAALLDVFAQAGAGLFAAPDLFAADVKPPRGLVRAGPIQGLRARYYAITAERRFVHPSVALVADSARQLFRRRKLSKNS